jgi:hypothetical protein
MKTAMKELTDYMKTYFHLTDESLEMFDKALEKEKEQIKKANLDGYKEGCTYHSFDHRPITSEEYYNQTYNQNK